MKFFIFYITEHTIFRENSLQRFGQRYPVSVRKKTFSIQNLFVPFIYRIERGEVSSNHNLFSRGMGVSKHNCQSVEEIV